jgi:hypothetical protein
LIFLNDTGIRLIECQKKRIDPWAAVMVKARRRIAERALQPIRILAPSIQQGWYFAHVKLSRWTHEGSCFFCETLSPCRSH